MQLKNKYILLFVFFSTLSLATFSQQYGNEWINYSQSYYKIKIPPGKDGINRITYSTLIAAGVPVLTFNPKNVQLYGRVNQTYMQEQYIYVKGESDNSFDPTDYIEFYARHNDGRMDSSMYIGTQFHPNPYYSLINDTAAYFLTWNSSVANRRMKIETDTNSVTYTPADYFINEMVQYGTGYYIGATYSFGLPVTDPQYTKSEGYFGGTFTNGTSTSNTFTTSNIFLGGPAAQLKTVVVGESQSSSPVNDHHLIVQYKDKNSVYNKLHDTLFTAYSAVGYFDSIPVSQLNSSTEIRFTSKDSSKYSVDGNRTAVAYTRMRFPHTFDLENTASYYMYVPDDAAQLKTYLKISNFNLAANDSAYIYDLTNHKRIPVAKSGSFLKALVPDSIGSKWCFITSITQTNTVTSLTPVGTYGSGVFTNYLSSNKDSAYIIITHKSLLSEVVNDYQPYRESLAGGLHNVIVADIDELYDQFACGIGKHPYSIRNFSKLAIDTLATPPKYLFLIGKSLHLNEGITRYRTNPAYYSKCLVPSFGEPPSDMLFTAQLVNSSITPAIPTGRLAAQTPSDVKIYLDKIKEHEANLPSEWMKNVLHFSGGGDFGGAITTYLNNYKNIIEAPYWGAHVTTFVKNDSDPISINTSDSLKALINNGVSMMTFFGHSSGQSWDVGIDQPQNYDNKAKYPFILSLGCYAGDIHSYDAQPSNSENFLLIQDKGAIAFLADVSLGLPDRLDIYATFLEKNLAKLRYGKSIATSIKSVIDAYETKYGTGDLLNKACMLEMTFHGDPAVSLNAPRLPDYKITRDDISFDTKWKTDSFKVFVVHTNIGKAVDSIYNVNVVRTFPGGKKTIYSFNVPAPFYKDTIEIKMPFDFINGVGLNKFSATVDFYDRIIEDIETNNTTIPEAELIIPGNDIIPVYPYKYAIIPNNTVTLKASTVNPFADSETYQIEMDTTDAYNSPSLLKTKITSKGGVITWSPPVTLTDSAVWYWRVSIDSTAVYPNPVNWRESSFQYIIGKRGWEQAHFFQFKNDAYQFVNYNKPQREFDFVNSYKKIHAQTGIYPNVNYDFTQYGIDYDFTEVGACGVWIFAFMDTTAINPVWSVYDSFDGLGQYDNYHCHSYRKMGHFDFTDTSFLWRMRIANFIDSIPNGYYVLAYTNFTNTLKDSVTKNLYPWFEKLGSGKIRSLTDTIPYAMIGRKGAPIGSAKEKFGTGKKSSITIDSSFTTIWKQGYILSEVIGPAFSWDSLFWRKHSVETISTDVDTFEIIGIKKDGTQNILYKMPMANAMDMYINPIVDATLYPNIQLKAILSDVLNTTPAQLTRWQVIYAPVPEAAVNQLVGAGYNFYNATMSEGEDVKFIFPIQNISEYSFTDSMLVTYWIQNKNGSVIKLKPRLKKKPFTPGEVIMDSIVVNSFGYPGQNSIFAEVNPVGTDSSQNEQFHFNNLASASFFVSGDKINPLLDVTFDGVHILNGDIVSAKPNILIKLKDENQFLALNSQSDFNVLLKKPTDALAQPLAFGTEMTFTPANLPNNSCIINYTPTFLQDGVYELTVQAKDRSGNISGSNDYKIRFEVVTRSTITNVMNYPNPFSTSTRFVFTLTGSEIPEYLKIQVLTITGKVVREITKEELGPIHIGRNITEYAWDGKDQFGDQLANGIYLYRAQNQLHGSSIEKRTTDADKYFTKEFGKMYLMR